MTLPASCLARPTQQLQRKSQRWVKAFKGLVRNSFKVFLSKRVILVHRPAGNSFLCWRSVARCRYQLVFLFKEVRPHRGHDLWPWPPIVQLSLWAESVSITQQNHLTLTWRGLLCKTTFIRYLHYKTYFSFLLVSFPPFFPSSINFPFYNPFYLPFSVFLPSFFLLLSFVQFHAAVKLNSSFTFVYSPLPFFDQTCNFLHGCLCEAKKNNPWERKPTVFPCSLLLLHPSLLSPSSLSEENSTPRRL